MSLDIFRQLDRIERKLDLLGRTCQFILDNQARTCGVDYLAAHIRRKTAELKSALDAINQPPLAGGRAAADSTLAQPEGDDRMASKTIDDLVAAVAAEDTVIDSAIALINGFSQRLADAIQAALAGGATAAELAPLTALKADVDAKAKALSDAVVANTPAPAPPVTP